MERKKLIIGIICLIFFWACNDASEKKEKSEQPEKVKGAKNVEKIIEEAVTVEWMYMDDSLRLLCKSLFYTLPWMVSDIRELPEMVTPELLAPSPLQGYELKGKNAGKLHDSLFYYHFLISNSECKCEILRFYKGNAADKNFKGFSVTEQIICNAKSNQLPRFMNEGEKQDEVKSDTSEVYEVHGHDH